MGFRATNEGKVKSFITLTMLLYSGIVAIKCNNIFVFFAMFMCTTGDFSIMQSRGAILPKRKERFTLGIIAFSLGHCLFILAMPTKISEILNVIAVISFYVLLLLVLYPKTRTSKIQYIPYAVCILANAVNAYLYSVEAAVGAGWFIVSDIMVALFEEKDPRWQVPIWITYTLAPTLLITAILLNS